MFTVILDGVAYNLRVRYETIQRSARIADGDNAGDMLSGLYRRDLIGTYYDYAMEVECDPEDPDTYNRFYEAITAPTPYHTVTLPFGDHSITFDAMVTAATDMFRGTVRGRNQWAGLTVNFTAKEPYIPSDDDILATQDSFVFVVKGSGN